MRDDPLPAHDVPPLLGLAGTSQAVANSLSPRMFEATLRAAGIGGYYIPMPIRERTARKALRSLPRLGFTGANVTMPFKRVAADIAHTRSDLVELTGVANTLVIKPTGHVHAESTDGVALAAAIADAGVTLNGRVVALLGAGGAATDAAFACAGAGAARLDLWNRSRDHAIELARRVRLAFPGLDVAVHDRLRLTSETAVLVGAVPPDALPGYDPALVTGMLVVDMAYRSSGRPTPLEQAAQRRGARVIDGRELLVRQGAASFRLWFGIDPPLDVMFAAVRRG